MALLTVLGNAFLTDIVVVTSGTLKAIPREEMTQLHSSSGHSRLIQSKNLEPTGVSMGGHREEEMKGFRRKVEGSKKDLRHAVQNRSLCSSMKMS